VYVDVADSADCGMICGATRAAVMSSKGRGGTIGGIIREFVGLGITGGVTARATVAMSLLLGAVDVVATLLAMPL
jgi:hypothetical protein